MGNEELEKMLADKSITKVVQMAPAVRVAIGEMFGYEPGTSLTNKLVGALRKVGFDYVFDTTFGADVTIVEENAELEQHLRNSGPFPRLSSCCPGFVMYLEKNYPELYANNMATVKSPMEVTGALIKTYFAQKQNIDPRKIYSVAVMPCPVKKIEAKRAGMKLDGTVAVDYVITTKELWNFLKSKKVDLRNCSESDFDQLMGLSSVGGRLFGATGGISESMLRYHARIHGGKLAEPSINILRGYESTREITFQIGGKELRILVIYGLQCVGGCVGGAGQPSMDQKIVKQRAEALRRLAEKAHSG